MKENSNDIKYIINKDSHFLRNLGIVLLSFTFGIVGGILGDRLCYEYDKSDINQVKEVSIYKEVWKNSENKNIESVAALASKWTVGISTKNKDKDTITLGDYTNSGSGVVYSEDGYIITSYHVIENYIKNNNEIYVSLYTGEKIKAKVIGVDKSTDVAVLKVDKKGLQYAKFSTGDVKLGEQVIAIGNPLGEELNGSVTVGYVSAVDRKLNIDGNIYTLIQTDAAINFGNSGGALLNINGEVVGINTAKAYLTGVEGINFATPYKAIDSVIQNIINGKKISRPFIGFYGTNITSSAAEILQIDEGILVKQLIDNTPASLAGVKVNDYILKIDGISVKTMEELNQYKNTKKPKDQVVLTIKRIENGKERVFDLKLVLGDEVDYDT